MNKLFVKNKIIPEYLFEDIVYDLQNIKEYESGIVDYDRSKTPQGRVKKNIRDSFSKNLRPSEFLDLNEILVNYCQELGSHHLPSTLIVKELEYLKYKISGHFKPHHDAIPNENPKKIRRFTTITLLSKTDDLEGGDLIVFDGNTNPINTMLEVGETILFYSTTYHQVTPIKKGGREVLVAWIYDR
jgi:predicted 2-oxoglutarate/Fe(II)-dependent dioxygenase YbiX